MEPIYEEVTSELGGSCIKATYENGIVLLIPIDEANADYQRYLNPEAEQSTPILSDEAETK
jgi:hypothetical protein